MRPTWEYVDQVLRYDTATGHFWWKQRGGGRRMWRPAGSKHSSGYWHVWVGGRLFMAHVLAYFLVTKRWPEQKIDHRDGDGLNNRWKNLRPASSAQNNQNVTRRKDNCSGHPGVHWDRTIGKWKAQASTGGKRHHLGLFETAEEAAEVRQRFVVEHYSHYEGRDRG